MLLHAMVSKSKFDDLLNELGYDEIKNLTMVEAWDRDVEIPLVTASISLDRFHSMAVDLQATPELDRYLDNNWNRLDIQACSEAGGHESENQVGLLSCWVHTAWWL